MPRLNEKKSHTLVQIATVTPQDYRNFDSDVNRKLNELKGESAFIMDIKIASSQDGHPKHAIITYSKAV